LKAGKPTVIQLRGHKALKRQRFHVPVNLIKSGNRASIYHYN
jgi:hypothetical protein